MTRYGKTMAEALKGINEKLKPSDGAGAYVKDFKKSDAPQFKGKSDEKKQKMAIAAYLDDKEENMNIGMNEKMMKGFVVRYTDKNGERLAVPYKTRDRAKEEVKALKKLGAKDIEITTHNLNFKEDNIPHISKLIEGKYTRYSDLLIQLGRMKQAKDKQGEMLTKKEIDKEKRKLGIKEDNIQEDGHTDVASAIRQCKTMIEDATQIASKLQGMNPEESLPSWWTNKLAVSSNSMNKLRDYFLVPTTEETESALVNEVAPVAMALGKVAARAAGAAAGSAVANKVMGKEGFASDAQRKAAFAQGYKAKGKDKKEEKDVPKGYHKMPDGKIMKDSEHKKEAVSPEQQAAIAISKKEKEKDDAILVDKKVKKEKTKFEAYTGVPNPRTEGRKSNYATDDEDEEGANKNIIMQLYKAISLRGRFDVVFDDGKKEKVKEPIAQKAIAIHRTFKTSRDRLAFQNKISKSYRDLLNAIR